jgi:hypothetical protein
MLNRLRTLWEERIRFASLRLLGSQIKHCPAYLEVPDLAFLLGRISADILLSPSAGSFVEPGGQPLQSPREDGVFVQGPGPRRIVDNGSELVAAPPMCLDERMGRTARNVSWLSPYDPQQGSTTR